MLMKGFIKMYIKIKNQGKKIKIIKIIFLIIWCILIFYFSNQSGNISQSKSDIFVDLFSKIFNDLSYDSLKNLSFLIRKLAHIFLYFILYLLSYNVFKNKKYSFLFCLIFAITDEVHQYFIPGRSCEIRDILIDTIGAFLGYLTIFFKKSFKILK